MNLFRGNLMDTCWLKIKNKKDEGDNSDPKSTGRGKG